MFGICNLSIVSLRAEPNDKSELVSQVLFGEFFRILEQTPKWCLIELFTDKYQGWVDSKQILFINQQDYELLSSVPRKINADLVEFVSNEKDLLTAIPMGCDLTFLDFPSINKDKYSFEGNTIHQKVPKDRILQTAFMYLNAPYLWGGKTIFGIDSSGFTQMVYKINGYDIPRKAKEQALIGEPLSFIEESEVGDLAFFDNEEGNIIHTGIIMRDNYIIHSYGKVRIDRLDHLGILNTDTGKHTHKLRIIKKII